jgi:hypothetical protein
MPRRHILPNVRLSRMGTVTGHPFQTQEGTTGHSTRRAGSSDAGELDGHFGRVPEKDGGCSWEKTDLVIRTAVA